MATAGKQVPQSSKPSDARIEARATFVFRALESGGREVSGTMAALNPQEVARRLRAEGKTVLSIGLDTNISAKAKSRPSFRCLGAVPSPRHHGRGGRAARGGA